MATIRSPSELFQHNLQSTSDRHVPRSSDTFQLDYTPEHTRLFIDQVHANTIGGFQPDTNSPDPNFGRCLQCAALDRARYKTSPLIQRSDFCATCFKQYCFDPSNPPSKVALPNRKLAFKNPDPTGFKGVASFLSTSKLPIALGFLGAAVAIGALIGFLYVVFTFSTGPGRAGLCKVGGLTVVDMDRCWRKKRQVRAAQYKQVAGLHEDDDGDEAPFAQRSHYPRDSTVSYGLSTYEMPYIPPETRDPYQPHHSDSDMPYVPEAQQPLAVNR